jgi:hypothetical protein
LIAPKPQYPDGYGAANYQDDDDDLEAFHQQSIMQDQDEQLEDVGHTVGNLRQQAREMGEELDDQVMYSPPPLLNQTANYSPKEYSTTSINV